MFARPAKRQRPIETEELRTLVAWLLGDPSPWHLLVLLQHLLHYFGLMRRGAVSWLTYRAVPGTVDFAADSHTFVGRWSGGECVHFMIYRDKNLLGGARRVTLPDLIPMLPGLSLISVLRHLLRFRSRDYGCWLGIATQALGRPDQRTFEEREWRASRALVCKILQTDGIATTAFRRGYVWALYRHNVSRDKLAKIGFWDPDSNAMDVYSGVSGQERCEHITSLTTLDILHT